MVLCTTVSIYKRHSKPSTADLNKIIEPPHQKKVLGLRKSGSAPPGVQIAKQPRPKMERLHIWHMHRMPAAKYIIIMDNFCITLFCGVHKLTASKVSGIVQT